jgi:hypothetical protein
MATRADIETDLTLEVGGHVSPEKFLRSVRAFFGLVSEITKTAAGDLMPPAWTVQVKDGSNLVGLIPVPGYHPAVVERVLLDLPAGMAALEQGDVPTGFTETALRNARDLGRVGDEPDDGDVTVRIWIKREPVAITDETTAAVNRILEVGFEDHGSVDGKLEVVSGRRGLHVLIADRLTGRSIRCALDDDLLNNALSLFGRRVEAYGLIRYRRDGVPLSIVVEEFVPFPDANDIPSFEKMRGILRGI